MFTTANSSLWHLRLCMFAASLLCLHATPASALDENNNQISDVWELFYFNGLLEQGESSLDPDGDFTSHLEESRWGSDPTDVSSRKPSLALALSGGNLLYEFMTRQDIRYQIQSSTDLVLPWADLGVPILGANNLLQGSTPAVSPRLFLRLRTAGSPDGDFDGLTAYDERLLGTSDATANSDTDSATDLEEVRLIMRGIPVNATIASTLPGVPDGTGDWDRDGVSDLTEIRASTDPADPLSFPVDAATVDGDQNGLPDAWEFQHNLTNQTSQSNPDGDHLTNIQEYRLGTDPNVALTNGIHEDGANDADSDQVIDVWELEDGTDPFNAASRDLKTNFVMVTGRFERKAAWGLLPNPGSLPLDTLYQQYMANTKLVLKVNDFATASQSLANFENKRGVISEVNSATTPFRFSGAGSSYVGFYANHLMWIRKGYDYEVTFSTTNPNLPFVSGRVTWTPVGTGGYPNSTLNDDDPYYRFVVNEVDNRQDYITTGSGQILMPAETITPNPDPNLTVFTLKGASATFNGPAGEATNYSRGYASIPTFQFSFRTIADTNRGWDPPMKGDIHIPNHIPVLNFVNSPSRITSDEEDFVPWTSVSKNPALSNEVTEIAVHRGMVSQLELQVDPASVAFITLGSTDLSSSASPIQINGLPGDQFTRTAIVNLKVKATNQIIGKMKVLVCQDWSPIAIKLYRVQDTQAGIAFAPEPTINNPVPGSGAIAGEADYLLKQARIPISTAGDPIPLLDLHYDTNGNGALDLEEADNFLPRVSDFSGQCNIVYVPRLGGGIEAFYNQATDLIFVGIEKWFIGPPEVLESLNAPPGSSGESSMISRVVSHEIAHFFGLSTRNDHSAPGIGYAGHDPGPFPVFTLGLVRSGHKGAHGQWLRHEDWDRAHSNRLDRQ